MSLLRRWSQIGGLCLCVFGGVGVFHFMGSRMFGYVGLRRQFVFVCIVLFDTRLGGFRLCSFCSGCMLLKNLKGSVCDSKT